MKPLAAAVAVLALAYLFGAFVAAEWDFRHWATDGRAMVAFFGLTFAAAAAGCAADTRR